MLIWSKANFQPKSGQDMTILAQDIRRRAHLMKHLDNNPEDTPLLRFERQTCPPIIDYQGGPKDHNPEPDALEFHFRDTIETGSYRDVRTGRLVKPRSDIIARENVSMVWTKEQTRADFEYRQEYWREDGVGSAHSSEVGKETVKHDVEHTMSMKFQEADNRYGVLVKEAARTKRRGVPSWIPDWLPFFGGHNLFSQFVVFARADGRGSPQIVKGEKASEAAWIEFSQEISAQDVR